MTRVHGSPEACHLAVVCVNARMTPLCSVDLLVTIGLRVVGVIAKWTQLRGDVIFSIHWSMVSCLG